MGVQLGDVPAWFAAVGTLGTFGFALRTFATDRKRRSEQEESDQANKIYVWYEPAQAGTYPASPQGHLGAGQNSSDNEPTPATPSAQGAGAGALPSPGPHPDGCFRYVNASGLPVRDLKVEGYTPDRRYQPNVDKSGNIKATGAFCIEILPPTNRDPARLYPRIDEEDRFTDIIRFQFRDANGIWWERTSKGLRKLDGPLRRKDDPVSYQP